MHKIIIGLSLSLISGFVFGADVWHEDCESIKPVWSVTARNGGTVSEDTNIKHEGKRSIKFSWTPGYDVADDGTPGVQTSPTERGFAFIRSKRFMMSDKQRCKFSCWIRTEGDIGRDKGGYAVLKVGIWYYVKGKNGKKSVVKTFFDDTKPHPLWTRIVRENTIMATKVKSRKLQTVLIPPPGTYEVEIRFGFCFLKRIATVWIDDVRMESL